MGIKTNTCASDNCNQYSQLRADGRCYCVVAGTARDQKGQCNPCPPYTKPNYDLSGCTADLCSGFYQNNLDGTCENQEQYEARIIKTRARIAKVNAEEAEITGGVGASCTKNESDGTRRACAETLCCGAAKLPLEEDAEEIQED